MWWWLIFWQTSKRSGVSEYFRGSSGKERSCVPQGIPFLKDSIEIDRPRAVTWRANKSYDGVKSRGRRKQEKKMKPGKYK
jgi:hypothetical protein